MGNQVIHPLSIKHIFIRVGEASDSALRALDCAFLLASA